MSGDYYGAKRLASTVHGDFFSSGEAICRSCARTVRWDGTLAAAQAWRCPSEPSHARELEPARGVEVGQVQGHMLYFANPRLAHGVEVDPILDTAFYRGPLFVRGHRAGQAKHSPRVMRYARVLFGDPVPDSALLVLSEMEAEIERGRPAPDELVRDVNGAVDAVWAGAERLAVLVAHDEALVEDRLRATRLLCPSPGCADRKLDGRDAKCWWCDAELEAP